MIYCDKLDSQLYSTYFVGPSVRIRDSRGFSYWYWLTGSTETASLVGLVIASDAIAACLHWHSVRFDDIRLLSRSGSKFQVHAVDGYWCLDPFGLRWITYSKVVC